MTEKQSKIPFFATVKKYSDKDLRRLGLPELLDVIDTLQDYPDLQAEILADLDSTIADTELKQNQVDLGNTQQETQKLLTELNEKLDKLSQKISFLEEQQRNINSISNLASKLAKEFSARQLQFQTTIRQREDDINFSEIKLAQVEPGQFLADMPNILRRLISIVTGSEDEIRLNELIARGETKIKQFQNQILKVMNGLATASVIEKAFGDAGKSQNAVIDSLRDVRRDLGESITSSSVKVKLSK